MNSGSRIVAVIGSTVLAALGALPAAAGEGPLYFFLTEPCRLVDTRLPGQVQGQYGPILTAGVIRKFPVQGNCGVPVGARAVAVNVTVVSPTAQGNLVLYPSGGTPPSTSNINFSTATPALANGAIVALADTSVDANDLSVKPTLLNNSGEVHMVLDVVGYFMP
jgi:hypothetical protein